MVDQIKATSKKTSEVIRIAYEIVWLGAAVAGAAKLATLPQLHTRHGEVSVWQFVAALLFATVVWKLVELHKSK